MTHALVSFTAQFIKLKCPTEVANLLIPSPGPTLLLPEMETREGLIGKVNVVEISKVKKSNNVKKQIKVNNNQCKNR